MTVRCALVFAVVVLTADVSRAQRSEPGDTWLTQNYHFAGPPPPGEIRPTVPVVSELQEIQNTLLAILRKANFAGDYEAALAAAAQATANAQLRSALAERQPTPQSHGATVDETRPKSAVHLIALKDESIRAATSCWTDRAMLHYITMQGAHEQVRMDLVDRAVTSELNRPKNRISDVGFRISGGFCSGG
jgi:hypothetical protein